MLPHLSGFDARRTAAGYLLVPTDARAGFIRYERRVRPLASVSSLIAPRIETMRVIERGPIVSLFTNEGEHAARVTLEGTLPSTGAVRRDIGIVFGDDFASIIDATCAGTGWAELFAAAVDKLTRELVLGAPFRRRRYRYTAPPDRTPRIRDLETDWQSADDSMTVFPAERAGREHVLAIAARNGMIVDAVERIDEQTQLVRASSAEHTRIVAARMTHGWLYAMELVRPRTPEEMHANTSAGASLLVSRDPATDALVACLASVEPLPAPLTRAAPMFGAFEVE